MILRLREYLKNRVCFGNPKPHLKKGGKKEKEKKISGRKRNCLLSYCLLYVLKCVPLQHCYNWLFLGEDKKDEAL